MTVPATLVRDGTVEIRAFVAFGTRHFCVFPRELELGGGVLELRAGAVFLEAIRIVAVIARALKLDFLEGPVVGIVVTALAAAVIQPLELSGFLIGLRSVALLASHGLMQSREREVGFCVTEAGSRLEAVLVVALEAIATELALMLILVTIRALTAETKKRPIQIFQLDLGPGGGRNLGSDVTLLAFLLPMLAV